MNAGSPSSSSSVRIDSPSEPQPPRFTADIQRLLTGRITVDDRMEYELLAFLMVSPELVPLVTRSVLPEEIGHPALRALFEHLVKLSTTDPGVTFKTFLASLEDADLKSLAVWLDTKAHDLELGRKLRESGTDPKDGCPLFLRLALGKFAWRREEQSFHDRTALPSSPTGDGTPTPDELLRQAQQFHQRRATK